MLAKLRSIAQNKDLRDWLFFGVLTVFLLTDHLRRPVRSKVYIQGAGNSGNRIYLEGFADELATLLAQREDCPQITDDELMTMMKAVREQAFAGDPQATLVMFRLAQLQRQKTQISDAAQK